MDAIYAKHTDQAAMPKRVLSYWADAVTSGVKTPNDFCSYIAELPEYRDKKLADFRAFFKLSCSADDDAGKYEADFLVFLKSTRFLMEHAEVLMYVRKLKPCRDHWIETINKLSLSLSIDSREVPIQELVDAWTQDMSFGNDKLAEALKSIVLPNLFVHDKVDEVASTKVKLDLLDTFEEVYTRPMFVQEYFKYVAAFSTHKDPDTFLKTLCAQHSRRFAKCNEVYVKYLNIELDERVFVRKFLDACDDVSFFDKLREDILRSEDYEAKMIERLGKLHVSMYDLQIDDREVAFLFRRVLEIKASLADDKLEGLVVDFKEERDVIADGIHGIYMKVFDRSPDEMELADYIVNVRCGCSLDEVELKLSSSLEFHEVVKDFLVRDYREKVVGSTGMPKRVLYAKLAHVLELKPGVDDLMRICKELEYIH